MTLDKKTVSFNKGLLLGAFFCLLTAAVSHGGEGVDIRKLGAKGDGKTLCTKAIQEAVDRCNESGGGMVRLPSGTWLTGTIFMKDNVTLCLRPGEGAGSDGLQPHHLQQRRVGCRQL